MDIDKPLSDDGNDYKEAEGDDDDREAPSEHDIDEANNKLENDHIEIHLDECGSTHTQSTPLHFGVSPLQAKALNFNSTSKPDHLSSLGHEPTKEQDHEDDEVGDPDHYHEDEREDYREDEREDDHEENDDDDMDAHEGSSQSLPSEESWEGLPPLSPSKPGVSTRSKHVSSRASPIDRHSRRHKPRVNEPVITESILEEKIVGILSKTLPQMLSGLFHEAMGQAKVVPSQQAPPRTP